jgi:hypothetical protein
MSQEYVYVVTRNKRRIESQNYTSLSQAEQRAASLRTALKQFDPKDVKKVDVVKTKKPKQIR